MQLDPSLADYWPDDFTGDEWDDEPDYDLELKGGEL